jgi:hypothetical protein
MVCGGTRVGVRRDAALEHGHRHTLSEQEHCGGHAGRATTGDEYALRVVRHVLPITI